MLFRSELILAADVDIDAVFDQAGSELITHTSSGYDVRAWTIPPEWELPEMKTEKESVRSQETGAKLIYAPLYEEAEQINTEDESEGPSDWRATGASESIAPRVMGLMVHKALELWILPENPKLIPLLETAVLNAGLAVPSQRSKAVQRAVELLTRLQDHPIRAEIEAAELVYHELPYSMVVGDHTENGYIDLLYLSPEGWQIVDFKTDTIRSAEERSAKIKEYSHQLRKYAIAVESLMDQKARTRICFLDDQGRVELFAG